jgi:hypothetical protein
MKPPKLTAFSLYDAPWPERPALTFIDFKLGSIRLSKHLSAQGVGSLSVDPRAYARQLLCKDRSEFVTGRVPLLLCHLCAGLDCGALTVCVERVAGGFIWRDFGQETPLQEGFSQTEYMTRAGPFLFDEAEYIAAIYPLSRRR